MDLREIGWEDIDNLEGSTWGWVVGPCEHSNEPLGSVKAVEFLD
jgi:hypothetical protein